METIKTLPDLAAALEIDIRLNEADDEIEGKIDSYVSSQLLKETSVGGRLQVFRDLAGRPTKVRLRSCGIDSQWFEFPFEAWRFERTIEELADKVWDANDRGDCFEKAQQFVRSLRPVATPPAKLPDDDSDNGD